MAGRSHGHCPHSCSVCQDCMYHSVIIIHQDLALVMWSEVHVCVHTALVQTVYKTDSSVLLEGTHVYTVHVVESWGRQVMMCG